MIEFWIGGLVLLLLAGVFLVLPGVFLRQRRTGGRAASNRDWYLQRQSELHGQDRATDSGVDPELQQDLLQDAQVRLLEDQDDGSEQDHVVAGEVAVSKPQWRALVLLLVVGLLSFLLYGQLGAGADVELARGLDKLSEDGSEADYRRLMLKVEDRAAQRPDNLHYQAMLGRFYMDEGDYGRARALYRSLSLQAPNDAGAAALAAQAGFLAAGRQLSAEDQLMAERALSIDPHQRTALGLLGMVAFETGEYRAAISYWRRLLVMEDPESPSAQMIRSVIARAEAAVGGAPAAAGPDHSTVAAASPPAAGTHGAGAEPALGVTLRLELPQGANASPGDTVFVFARNPALQTRMPVAVQRLTASQLPLTLRLDDASSMAGQKISELAAVDVVARVSPSGQPGEQHATFQASVSGLSPGPGEQVHTLVLRPVGDS